MESWDLRTVEVEPHQPRILASADDARTIVARSDARLLMVLSPWPGDGHPGAMTLEEKAEAREKAAQHSQ